MTATLRIRRLAHQWNRRQRGLHKQRRAMNMESLDSRLVLTSELFPSLQPLIPLGGFAYGHSLRADLATGETDSYTLEVDADQLLTAAVTPRDPSLDFRVSIIVPNAT